jgi:hypothetical protein
LGVLIAQAHFRLEPAAIVGQQDRAAAQIKCRSEQLGHLGQGVRQ